MKPSMGAQIPGLENMDKIGGGGNPAVPSDSKPILNAIASGVGDNTTSQSQSTPQVNWGDNGGTTLVADPNNNYQPTQTGINQIGVNPNTDINAGVPIYNTPSTNQQGAPGFGLNQPYQSTPDVSHVLATLGISDLKSGPGRYL